MIRVAHPFRGEGFRGAGKIVPRERNPSGLKGLSYNLEPKKTPPANAEGVPKKNRDLCYAINWPRRINPAHAASIPQISSASVPGSGVCTMNSCT